MAKAKVLIAEDEILIAVELKAKIESRDYNVVSIVPSGEEAVKTAEEKSPDLIILDIQLQGDMDGIDAADLIHKRADIPVIYMTGNDHLREDKRLLASCPSGILSKPAMDWELFEMIEKALKKQ